MVSSRKNKNNSLRSLRHWTRHTIKKPNNGPTNPMQQDQTNTDDNLNSFNQTLRSDHSQQMHLRAPVPKVFLRSLIHGAARLGLAIENLPYMTDLYGTEGDQSIANLATLEELTLLVESIYEVGNLATFLPMVNEVDLSGLEEVISMAIASKTVKETLTQASNLPLLAGYGIHLSVHHHKNSFVMECETAEHYSPQTQRTIVDAAFGMIQRVLEPVVKPPSGKRLIEHIELATNNDSVKMDYEKTFSCPVTLTQSSNAIFLNVEACTTSLSSSCEPLKAQALKAIEVKTQQLQDHQSYQGKVRALLSGCENLSENSIDDIAKQLNTSVRTLQKRLNEEGNSFSQLKLQAVIERSKKLLRSDALNIDQISDTMGFADASSFRRAFRRASGISPTQYRKQHKTHLSSNSNFRDLA